MEEREAAEKLIEGAAREQWKSGKVAEWLGDTTDEAKEVVKDIYADH